MNGLDLLTFGTEQYRIGSWRGHADTGYLAPLTPPEQMSRAGLERARERLARRGYRQVLTAALTASEQPLFRTAGFTVHERLHLLRHDLTDIRALEAPCRLRRAHRWERRSLLDVDGSAFEAFWRLDSASLTEAVQATPVTRVRVAVDGGVLGYAITGCAADVGYLQRLAVHPSQQGRGIGAALVSDALTWLRSRNATTASVNTQEANDRALALYERAGFVRVEPGLAVLRCELAARS
ncbi:MAG TPA: GNAT family N-acetyltransferase [Acidimicrobiales bacterium]|jgi:ribosomal protein S18 acetylase RimI-like enzyme|nr:GNAT family N-acetyltransferase [Acidimicrobiales bacterium]